MEKIDIGEIYYGYNDVKRGMKYHIRVADRFYVFVNTEERYDFNLPITKEKGKILDYDSYICLKDFLDFVKIKPNKQAKLDNDVLEKIISKVAIHFVLSDRNKDIIIKSLNYAIQNNL